MQKLINLLLMLVLSAQAFAQTQIKGVVRDGQGQTIPGANIYLKDTFDGAVSQNDGSFTFETYEEGSHILVVSFIGFKTLEKPVQVEEKSITLELKLEEEINKIDGVTITAGSYEAGEVKKNTVLKPLDIATTASAVGDIMGAINTLPGTATVGESGRLFVRGGEGYETKVFIDGLEVRNAFGATAPNVPTRGRFSPFLFKGTSFSTGGYSAEYGQALSSALVLNSNDMPTQSQADISIMSVGGDVAYTKKWDKTSVSGKVLYTDFRPYQNLIKQRFDWEEAPSSVGSEFVIRHKVSQTGIVKVYLNTDRSSFSIKQENINRNNVKDTFDLENRYFYLNASYKDILNKQWSIKSGVSVTNNKDNLSLNRNGLFGQELGMHSKLALQWDASEKLSVNMGADWFSREYLQRTNPLNESPFKTSFKENIMANFVEADYYASNRFVVRAGLRSEYTSLTDQHFMSPRVAMSYKLNNEGQFSLAYGQFVQAPQNEYSIVQPALKPERATHYILNYQHIKNDRIFRVETYYKDYEDLVKFEVERDFDPNNYNNNGFGSAKGLDVFWRDNKSIKNTDYWVSYSYVDSEREYQNFDQLMTPSFLSAHNFSVVVKHMIDPIRTQVGASYNFASARHFHNPNEAGFQNSSTPAYHDVSLNAAVLLKQNIILYMSSSNIFGRENIFGYEYADQANDQGVFESRVIGQAAKRFVFVGLFITLTKDKQTNQLNNL
ncbi:MAG: TonB-dependent receptor [Roseivirga sp.]|uniref:TonB-dependent receptor n=1 Tax=Roseivirga sp. TaxID=1964215 RepID=UPI001B236B9D|nr:TonB-dependent receptor [Roseivirga sp.]MBO6661255.1 TonB-dependent receptor [Roseivirga sp.]MBO6761814.1 TonB-dependent receptor [Roseivirga sp.]MBO6908761.1 TonB-dependent receptor [Roseivirga sp.]